MSPFEEALWDYLPPAVWWLALLGGIVAVVCFVLSWRLSKNKGHLLLAAAVAIPLLLSASGGLRKSQSHAVGADGIPIVHVSVRVDLLCISMLVAAGASSIYRKEKKADPAGTDNDRTQPGRV